VVDFISLWLLLYEVSRKLCPFTRRDEDVKGKQTNRREEKRREEKRREEKRETTATTTNRQSIEEI